MDVPPTVQLSALWSLPDPSVFYSSLHAYEPFAALTEWPRSFSKKANSCLNYSRVYRPPVSYLFAYFYLTLVFPKEVRRQPTLSVLALKNVTLWGLTNQQLIRLAWPARLRVVMDSRSWPLRLDSLLGKAYGHLKTSLLRTVQWTSIAPRHVLLNSLLTEVRKVQHYKAHQSPAK